MIPLEDTDKISLPAGDTKRKVYLAKDAQLSEGLKLEKTGLYLKKQV